MNEKFYPFPHLIASTLQLGYIDIMPNTIYTKRSINPLICKYLNFSYSPEISIDYYIDIIFEDTELEQTLVEDLPSSSDHLLKQAFIKDIVQVTKNFFNTTKSKKIRIQIETIKSDSCRLFHEDNLKQRLLCTYYGPGTEWLEESNLEREGLGKGDNHKIVRDFSKVKHANPFDILVLKGKIYSQNFSGAVHRSPPVEKTGSFRVLLKIDEL